MKYIVVERIGCEKLSNTIMNLSLKKTFMSKISDLIISTKDPKFRTDFSIVVEFSTPILDDGYYYLTWDSMIDHDNALTEYYWLKLKPVSKYKKQGGNI